MNLTLFDELKRPNGIVKTHFGMNMGSQAAIGHHLKDLPMIFKSKMRLFRTKVPPEDPYGTVALH
jgi:hypothetical protein